MPALADVAREKLQALASADRARTLKVTLREDSVLATRAGKRLISFSCNDYLGLSRHQSVIAAATMALQRYGSGAGASRLVTGNHPLYEALEAGLAAWKGTEAALVFGSGYLANIGVLPALVSRDDVIIADRLVHACLIDGARISGAKLLRFAHNDAEDCERLLAVHRSAHRHCLVVTEEVFSMDGDKAPLADLRRIAGAHDAWLMVDGAHALLPVRVTADIYVGTLSKAFGAYGGFACGSREVMDYLVADARSFIFSTGLPPSLIASALAALEYMQDNPAALEAPLQKARKFTEALGLPLAESQIVPVLMGDEKKALAAAAMLEEAGFLVAAIRPPTVPARTSRLRFAFSAVHRDEDIMALARCMKDQRIV